MPSQGAQDFGCDIKVLLGFFVVVVGEGFEGGKVLNKM